MRKFLLALLLLSLTACQTISISDRNEPAPDLLEPKSAIAIAPIDENAKLQLLVEAVNCVSYYDFNINLLLENPIMNDEWYDLIYKVVDKAVASGLATYNLRHEDPRIDFNFDEMYHGLYSFYDARQISFDQFRQIDMRCIELLDEWTERGLINPEMHERTVEFAKKKLNERLNNSYRSL